MQSIMKAPNAPDDAGSLLSGDETTQINSAGSGESEDEKESKNTTYSAPIVPSTESTADGADDRSLDGAEYSDDTVAAKANGFTNDMCSLPKAENGTGDENKSGGGGGSSDGGTSAGSNSGANASANANAIDFETLAERQFEKLSEQYPNRISRELFDSIGAEKYLAFLSSLEDFDADYNAERFAAFAAEQSAG